MMNNSKLEELLNTARINELLHKKELEEKNKNGILVALAIVGVLFSHLPAHIGITDKPHLRLRRIKLN